AAGDPVFVSRGPLAEALGGDGEDQFVLGLQLGHALGREGDGILYRRLFGLGGTVFRAAPLLGGDAQIGVALLDLDIDMVEDRHGDDIVAALQLDAADADGIAAGEDAHIGHREADRLAAAGGEQNVVLVGADGDADQLVALFQLHGDLAIGLHID